MSQTTFLIWVLALAVLLVWPVSRLVWVLSVRRMQRKLARELEADEVRGQRRRAWIIAVVLSLLFSWVYNASRLGLPGGG